MKKFWKTVGTIGLSVGLAFGLFKVTEAPVTQTIVISDAAEDDGTPAQYTALPMVPPGAGQDFTVAIDKSLNTVVHITSLYNQTSKSNDPFYDFFNGGRGANASSGSGVIISEDGYIITNNHVIESADKLTVTLGDKREIEAKVIGTDPSTDLALIKVEASDLPFVTFGNSDDVKVGQWVLAMGNPFNLNNTVTAGIVSAKGRNINLLKADLANNVIPLESFIQTDAAVNPGNSGGALINTEGELIGINTAIASQTGSYAGYSFAIPVNIVDKVARDLLEFGQVQRAFIGVSIRDIDQNMATKLNLKDMAGVFVAELTEGGAAADAGIEPGDIITHVGAVKVDNVAELQEQIARFRPGQEVAVTINRDSKPIVKNMVLRNQRGQTELLTHSASERKMTEALGARFSDLSREEAAALKIDAGVRVDEINSGKLRNSGIREGFIITKVDKQPVHNAEELIKILENKDGGVLVEGVYPNGMRAYYGFGL